MTMHFDNTYARLPERFFARQHPVRVPEPTLIRLNRGLAAELSLDTEWLQSAEGVATLAGNAVPEGAERRCCMNTRYGWGGVARTSLDPPQEPHYGDEVEGSSQA